MMNPVYDEVIAFQKAFYTKMINSPKSSDLTKQFNFFNKTFPDDVLIKIVDYDHKGHMAVKHTLAEYSFPTCQTSLLAYKQSINELLISINSQSSVDLKAIACANELQRHVDAINKQIEIKEQKKPSFFSENPDIALEVSNKIQAITKAINWLHGESDLLFSPSENHILNQGTVGDQLHQYNIELPLQPDSVQLNT